MKKRKLCLLLAGLLILTGCTQGIAAVTQTGSTAASSAPGSSAASVASTSGTVPTTAPTAAPTVPLTGWQTVDGKAVYYLENGTLARGRVVIDGVTRYFSSRGEEILLVNPWNSVPEDYDPELVWTVGGGRVTEECDPALRQMIADCQAAGYEAVICSAYRSQSFQEDLYEDQVYTQMYYGLRYEDAVVAAGKIVAVPGTSEHQLGLAVDIMDADYQYLDNKQADMPAQQWLMEHCWEYGFILRYPTGKTDITGIIYEPWHYRYVGTELARELYELGLCLEEYIDMLTGDGVSCGGAVQ